MMKWYDIRFWKWATITLVVGLALVSVLGCSTPRAVTTQTFITDKQSEKKFDSLFTTRLSYAFEQWQHIQKRETEKATKDSSYVKDSTATRYDAQGNKIGEDRFHYESHYLFEKERKMLLDTISTYKAYKDSFIYYRGRCDSLSKIGTSQFYKIDAPSIKEKSLSSMQKIFLKTGQMFWFCFILIVMYLLYISRKKKKES